MRHAAGQPNMEWGDLLSAMAEQLKVPLTIIARQAELGEVTGQAQTMQAQTVQTQADAALQLVDSYLLGLELLRGQTQLQLEPVSVSSTLIDTAHALSQFAKQYGVAVTVDVGGKYEPVMAHARGLRAALLSLGFGLVEAQAVPAPTRRTPQITLAVHRAQYGIVAGVYTGHHTVSAASWRRARQLYGHAPQPCIGLGSGTGAGLFVADTILRSMSSGLRAGRHNRQSGLAAALQPSYQLQFV
jgi:hypothetical protein